MPARRTNSAAATRDPNPRRPPRTISAPPCAGADACWKSSPNATCFEILARELDDVARPVESSTRPGRRFLACRDGFADPASYPADSDITVVGEITDFETRPIGDYDYRYPVLRLDAAHVWPERRTVDPSPLPPPRWWYDPYWRYSPYYY